MTRSARLNASTASADAHADRSSGRPSRSLASTYVGPDQPVSATGVLPDSDGRVVLRESIPGELVDEPAVRPEPVALDHRDDRLTVCWDLGDETSPPAVEYTVSLSADVDDGETITVDGTVLVGDGELSVAGTQELTVVDDVFQRVVARGGVADADLRAVAESDVEDLSGAALGRLCRAWARAD